MPGLFQGLEVGKRALLTSQLTLQTIGHNIANVNTPGYTRQRVTITSSLPESQTYGTVGSGVEVKDIRQIRDLFLGQQYREANKSLGEWTYKEKVLSQIESLFNEPNDNTLSDLMNNFWNSWDDFSKQPSSSTRDQVISQTLLMTNGFHELAEQLHDLKASIDSDIGNFTYDINQITTEIANLNHQIARLEMGNSKANDLRDKRDLLVDNLSDLINVNTMENPDGQMTVYIGAMSIVNGNTALHIEDVVGNKNGELTHTLMWEGSDVELTNTAGQLSALVDLRDEIIPNYMEQLDLLASTIAEQVNSIHVNGVTADGRTGIPFFDIDSMSAATIRINEAITSDPTMIISSTSGEESDNTLALDIVSIRDNRLLNNNSATISDYYNSIIGSLGGDVMEAGSFTENYELMVQQVDFARQSVQGVSLDEEMTNMVKYQHAYDAAARVITTMDQALDTVINGMGLVGR